MKQFVAAAVLMLACVPVMAQDSAWKWKGMFGASYNATSVSENWSGSEKNAQSWGAKLDVSGERDTTLNNFAMILKEEYGRTKAAGAAEQVNADLIDLSSVFTRKLSFYVNPYAGFIVNTQHYRFFDPVTYSESLGNGVWLINSPVQQLKTRTGIAFHQKFGSVRDRVDPVTGLVIRYSAVDDPATAEIEGAVYETGGEWITNYDVLFNANTKFITEARVFSAFKGGANLRWDNSLYVKLSKLLTLQLNYLMIYNYDQAPHPVWPQGIEKRMTVILGFSYNMF